jgi:hypothetical protein
MIEINRLGRQSLAGEINVIRARTAKAAAAASGGFDRAEIKNMEGPIGRFPRRQCVEDHQSSDQKNQKFFQVLHAGSAMEFFVMFGLAVERFKFGFTSGFAQVKHG